MTHNLEKNFISCVIYARSAASIRSLEDFTVRLTDTMSQAFEHYEMIFVDDECPAPYIDAIKHIHDDHKDANISILHMSHYQGLETSMNAGRDLAIGDYVIEFDECTYNYPADLIMQAYRRCLEDIDIVSCVDDTKNKFASNLFYSIFNHFSESGNKLHSDNFRVLSRRSINRIQALSNTIPYRKALYYESGLSVDLIHYTPEDKGVYKHDKKSRDSRRGIAIDALVLFTDIGYKCAFALSVLMACIMVLVAIYAIIIYLKGIAIVGWTTTILFLAFAFFGLFALLTIVIKYLSLILGLNFKKNRYLFKNIEKL